MQLPILYQKTASGSINYWQVWTEGNNVCVRWGQVGTSSPQQQVYPAEPKNVGRANETTAEKQAEFEAESLWKKKKRTKYFENPDDAETKLNLKPMLAQNYLERLDKGDISFPVYVQPKLNGYRALVYRQAGDIKIQSRGGKFYAMKHIADELMYIIPAGDLSVVLDGELYVHGMSLQRLGSLVKKPRYQESNQVQFHVYDIILAGDGIALGDEIWERRLSHLYAFYRTNLKKCQSVKIVDSVIATSIHEVKMLHKALVSDGYEGVIVRLRDHPYRFGYRSPGLLKYKTFEDKEFPIVGWTVGKDNVPLWVCRQEDGYDFEVRPIGTAEERSEMLKNADQQIGKMLKVRYQERTESNIPHIARGIEIRDESDL